MIRERNHLMDVRELSFIYLVVTADDSGNTDVVGLTHFCPVNPISPEIRTNIGNHVSRLIMRPVKLALPHPCCGNSPAVIYAWEAVNLELAVKRNIVREFVKWTRIEQAEIDAIRADFGFAVQPFFRVKRREPEKWMAKWCG
jgi:hypothetical protein